MLERFARWCFRRRRWVAAGWVAILVGFQALGSAVGSSYGTSFAIPGAESQHAIDLLRTRFPERSGDSATIVFRADAGVVDPSVRRAMEPLFEALAGMPHVLGVASPYAPEARSISPDGRIAFATVQFDVRTAKLPRSEIEGLFFLVREANRPGLQVELGGEAIRFGEIRSGVGSREGIGLLAAVVILLAGFGSAIAMGLPILAAIFGLGVGFGLIALFTHVLDVPEFAPQVASMIGLGVGIDYSLLIVTRYRQGLHAGLDPEEATAVAITTAGRSVIFAGGTVVISLAGMFFMGLALIRGIAVGAMVAVVLGVAVAVTLLPAALGFAGSGIDRLRVPGLHRDESAHRASAWFRWSRVVQHRPWVAFAGGLAALVVLAVPFFSIRLGVADAGSEPDSRSTRRAYDLLSEGFGPGFNGPFVLVAELPGRQAARALNGLVERLARVPGVVAVTPPQVSEGGDAAVVTVIPASAPQDRRTEELLGRLREEVVPGAVAGTGIRVSVGGVSAVFVDISEFLGRRLPWLVGGVVGLSFLLLMVVFRSVLVPLKAAIVNLLSIGAAYGVVVAVFQWGWLGPVIGIDRTGPIESFMPMVLFAVLFGLSMDYEVFLLSRIREEYLLRGENSIAVADGLAATARVITAAAAIMVTVFLSFVASDERIIKLAGLGLASAIFIDATLVRIVLVPATMELLGEANWWFPKWLDRIVPRISFETEGGTARRVLETEVEGAGGEPSLTGGGPEGG